MREIIITLLLFTGINAYAGEDDWDWCPDLWDLEELGYSSYSLYITDIDGSYGYTDSNGIYDSDNPHTGGNETHYAQQYLIHYMDDLLAGRINSTEKTWVILSKLSLGQSITWITKSTYKNSYIGDNNGNGVLDYIEDIDGNGKSDIIEREDPFDDPNKGSNDYSSNNDYSSYPVLNNLNTSESITRNPDNPDHKVITAKTQETDANKAMLAVQDILEMENIKDTLDVIRTYAKEKYVEYGFAINFYFESEPSHGTYKQEHKRAIVEGEYNRLENLDINQNTVIRIHSHHDDERKNKYNIAAPAPKDFESALNHAIWADSVQREQAKVVFANNEERYQAYLESNDRKYKGELNVAYNGDEYFLFVYDLDKAKTFQKTHGKSFVTMDNEITDKKLDKDYEDALYVFVKIMEPPLTDNEARCFALAYLLEKNDAGIKMMKKASGENFFAEQNFERNSDNSINSNKPVSLKHP